MGFGSWMLAIAGVAGMATVAPAQQVTLAPIAAPPQTGAIPLGTGGGAAGTAPESWFTFNGQAAVRNVAVATLTPVLPAKGKATGAAVIVAPGGGFLMESMANEAWPQARWLADHGIAAFVLKYRTQPSPAALDGFRTAMTARFAAAVAKPGERSRVETPPEPIADAQAALRLVRARATEWGVDPRRVGLLGFSAGAMTALGVVAAGAADAMPDFIAPIYPSMAAMEVAATAPPMFVAIAADDQLFGHQGYGLAESWRKANRPVELHVYEHGGHGFGMGKPGTTSTGWIAAFHAWMAANGWLGAAK